MSNFYLCDLCANMRHRLTPTTCMCSEMGAVPMRVHGVGGVRYEEPRKVCGTFRPKDREDGDREDGEGGDE